MRTIVVIIILSCYSLIARAQILDDTIPLSEVVVRSSVLVVPPGIVKTTVDTTFIIDNPFNAITEILHNYTPVFVKSYGNGGLATVSFRGTHASHTKVQWNDMNINSPMLGQVDFSNIPVFFFDEMELYHGNSSLLNGSGGLGGSIKLGTNPDWNNKFNGSFINQVGSFGTYNTGLKIGFGNKKTQLKTRIFYGKSDNDFEYFNNSIPGGGRETNENASFQSIHLMQEVYYHLSPSQQLSLSIWGGVNTRNVPTLMNYSGVFRKEELEDKDFKATLGWSCFDKNGSQWRFNSGYNYSHLNYFMGDSVDNFILDDAFNTISNSVSATHSLQNKFSWQKKMGELGEWNADIYHQYEHASTHDDAPLSRNGYDAERNKFGVMLNIDKAISSRVSSFLIIRQELVDEDFLLPSPLIGFKYTGYSSWNPGVRFSISANNNIPTLNALYWVPWGNEDLKAEKGYSTDFGVSISKQTNGLQIQSGVNLFGSYMYDWIMWVPGKSAQNVQEVFSRGLEVNVRTKYQLAGVNIFFSGNYSYTRTTCEKSSGVNDNSEGKQLIYIPLHKVGTYVKCDFKRYYLKHTFTYTDKRYGSLDNDLLNALPEYCLHDVVVGKEFLGKSVNLNIYAGVQNLFDQAYQSILYRAMPGRHYTFSMILNFNNIKK